jgi:hypothetical protein
MPVEFRCHKPPISLRSNIPRMPASAANPRHRPSRRSRCVGSGTSCRNRKPYRGKSGMERSISTFSITGTSPAAQRTLPARSAPRLVSTAARTAAARAASGGTAAASPLVAQCRRVPTCSALERRAPGCGAAPHCPGPCAPAAANASRVPCATLLGAGVKEERRREPPEPCNGNGGSMRSSNPAAPWRPPPPRAPAAFWLLVRAARPNKGHSAREEARESGGALLLAGEGGYALDVAGARLAARQHLDAEQHPNALGQVLCHLAVVGGAAEAIPEDEAALGVVFRASGPGGSSKRSRRATADSCRPRRPIRAAR